MPFTAATVACTAATIALCGFGSCFCRCLGGFRRGLCRFFRGLNRSLRSLCRTFGSLCRDFRGSLYRFTSTLCSSLWCLKQRCLFGSRKFFWLWCFALHFFRSVSPFLNISACFSDTPSADLITGTNGKMRCSAFVCFKTISRIFALRAFSRRDRIIYLLLRFIHTAPCLCGKILHTVKGLDRVQGFSCLNICHQASPGLVFMSWKSIVSFGTLLTKGTRALPIFTSPCPASTPVI